MPSAHILPYGLAAMLALLPGWQQREERAPAATHIAAPANTAIERAKDGFFYVTADVDGVPVRFLVDTGASIAILSDRDARRIGLAPRGTTIMRTVGGDVPMARATLPHMAIAGRKLIGVDAVVAPGHGQSLIGQRVLAQFASVTMRGDTMHFD